jgi:hypothetical protein
VYSARCSKPKSIQEMQPSTPTFSSRLQDLCLAQLLRFTRYTPGLIRLEWKISAQDIVERNILNLPATSRVFPREFRQSCPSAESGNRLLASRIHIQNFDLFHSPDY